MPGVKEFEFAKPVEAALQTELLIANLLWLFLLGYFEEHLQVVVEVRNLHVLEFLA